MQYFPEADDAEVLLTCGHAQECVSSHAMSRHTRTQLLCKALRAGKAPPNRCQGHSAKGIIGAFSMLMRHQQLLLGTALVSSTMLAATIRSCELNPCPQLRKNTLQAHV